MTRCIICDLDGTLANSEHRLHWILQDEPDWEMFFNETELDTPFDWCAEIISSMSDKYPIIYVTARGEECRAETEAWLQEYGFLFAGSQLHMRPIGDKRQDDILKKEILEKKVLTKYDPLFILEDRKIVVDMFRSMGLTVLQCDKGEY